MAFPHWYYFPAQNICYSSFSFSKALDFWFFFFTHWVCFFLLSFVQEKLYGKSITLADREMVEEKADEILLEARGSDVAFLVVGDPFGYGICLLIIFLFGFCGML
jgi:hypothetical protein